MAPSSARESAGVNGISGRCIPKENGKQSEEESSGRGKGGKCQKSNVNYIIECMLCPPEERCTYIGETSRNLYTRAIEHQNNKDEEGFMNRHMRECHPNEERNFVAKVTHVNKDCLTRQVREGCLISNSKVPLLNTKSEWFQPPLFKVQSEVIRV